MKEKLTDEKIIKGAECCSKSNCEYDCVELGCPYYIEEKCSHKVVVDAVDLIKRQKAKIKEKDEMLKAQASKIFLYEDVLKEKTAEVEQWKDKYMNLWCEPDSDIHKVKAEAIKMFAERLKEELVEYVIYEQYPFFGCAIDNVVKDMDESNKLQQDI